MSNRKNIYLPDHILDRLAKRGPDDSLSGSITTILDRYFEIMRRTKPWTKFSEAEIGIMRDACMSWLPDPATTIFGGIAMEVEDSIPDGLEKKWNVDVKALLAKLADLSPAEEVALVDYLKRQTGL